GQERRILAEPVEDEGDHPGRRRLPVGARYDDRVLERDELGEELSSSAAGHPAGEGGRDDGLPPLRRPNRLRLNRDRDSCRTNVLEVRRLDPVPAPDLRAPRLRDNCIAGESRAADPDESEIPVLEPGP